MLEVGKKYKISSYVIKRITCWTEKIIVCESEYLNGVVIIGLSRFRLGISEFKIENINPISFLVRGVMKVGASNKIVYNVTVWQSINPFIPKLHGTAEFIKDETILEHLLKTDYYE